MSLSNFTMPTITNLIAILLNITLLAAYLATLVCGQSYYESGSSPSIRRAANPFRSSFRASNRFRSQAPSDTPLTSNGDDIQSLPLTQEQEPAAQVNAANGYAAKSADQSKSDLQIVRAIKMF